MQFLQYQLKVEVCNYIVDICSSSSRHPCSLLNEELGSFGIQNGTQIENTGIFCRFRSCLANSNILSSDDIRAFKKVEMKYTAHIKS